MDPSDFIICTYSELLPLAVFRHRKGWWIKGTNVCYRLKHYIDKWDEEVNPKTTAWLEPVHFPPTILVATNNHSRIRFKDADSKPKW